MPSVYANNKIKQVENNTWAKLYELIPEGSKVLDVGCSSGNFGAELIRRKNCEVVGLDINDEDLELAKEQLTAVYKKNIETDDVDSLGNFDIVLMADVIEHLIDPIGALKKLKKVLKPTGELIFSVPNMANIATRIELLKGRFEYTSYGLLDQTHLHYYDRVQLEKVFIGAGLRVEEYNNTIRDLPKNIVEKELKSIGLTASDKFFKLVDHIDSITFQFVGRARANSQGATHAVVNSKTPYDFVSKRTDEERAEYESRLLQLKKEIKNKDKIIARLSSELERIHSSRAWRVLSKAANAKGKLTGTRRN